MKQNLSVIQWANTFLSHHNSNSILVKQVADELGKRGIIAWLDKNEILPGNSLQEILSNAVKEQTAFLLFLSMKAVKSAWVEEELAAALEKDSEQGCRCIIPVFLEDPETLVKAHRLLKNRWMSADGDKVDLTGILCSEGGDSQNAVKIAENAAKFIFDNLGLHQQNELIIYLDQRGHGGCHGIPENVQDNILTRNAPALVFRPGPDNKTQSAVIFGEEWDNFAANITWALDNALKGTRWPDPKKIRIMGESQLALPFLLGHYFNRSTDADLYCYNRGDIFSNKGQERQAPLTGTNPNCESQDERLEPISEDYHGPAIALFLMGNYTLDSALAHWETMPEKGPGVWVESGKFTESSQVMAYISDVVALLQRLRREHNITKIYLYTGLPFHVLPILACNLLHVIHQTVFMEYRRDLQDKNPEPKEMYVPIEIKG